MLISATVAARWTSGERPQYWRRAHAATGTTLAQADCLIAAAAVAEGVPLAPGNPKGFPTAGLDVQHWRVGD